MILSAREIFKRHGSILLREATEINEFYKSGGGEITFSFYDRGLNNITTPAGMISPLGNRVGGDEDAAQLECIEYFGLELVEEFTRNHEHWQNYKATRNIPT